MTTSKLQKQIKHRLRLLFSGYKVIENHRPKWDRESNVSEEESPYLTLIWKATGRSSLAFESEDWDQYIYAGMEDFAWALSKVFQKEVPVNVIDLLAWYTHAVYVLGYDRGRNEPTIRFTEGSPPSEPTAGPHEE